MKIKYKYTNYYGGKEIEKVENIEDFVQENMSSIYSWYSKKENKEIAFGRLLDFLLEKGLMNKEEFLKIVGLEFSDSNYELIKQ